MSRIRLMIDRLAREERGQNVIEWAGALVVVAVIIAGVITLTPALGRQIDRGVTCTVDKILHTGGCSTASTPVPPNEVVCESSSGTNDISDQLQVFFVQLGHDNTLIKTVYSNGQVAYTLTNSGSVQAQAKLFQLEAEAGPLGGVDAQITAAAGGQLVGSNTFQFPNAKTADAFAKQVQSAGGWGVVAHDVASGIPLIGGPVVGGLLNVIGIHGAPSNSDLAQEYKQYETGSYVGIGAVGQLQAQAQANLGPIGVQLNAQLNAAGGAREITSGPDKGDVALYISLKGKADAALLAGVFGPNANASGSGTAVVTLNHSGQPINLQVNATGAAGATGLEASGTRKGEPADPDAEGDGGPLLKKLNLDSFSTPGTGYLYSANVNLAQDPNAVSDLLGVLNPTDAGQGLTNLESAIGTYGTQQIQPFHQQQSSTTAGVNGEVLDIGGGVSATQSSTDQTFTAGWIEPQGSSTWLPTICQR